MLLDLFLNHKDPVHVNEPDPFNLLYIRDRNALLVIATISLASLTRS